MFGNKNKSIGSFKIVTLRETGMRGSTEYEIVMKDDEAEISFYWIKYTQGKDSRELDKRAVCSKETVVKLLNDCNILSWNGFVGINRTKEQRRYEKVFDKCTPHIRTLRTCAQ